MLEITQEDITLLGDGDLRTLIGLLCEAEARSRKLSPVYVSWGGDQNAADDGIDVEVSFPTGTEIEGFIPRANTGFQVKKPDMLPSAIQTEMRPGGELRPAIQELACKSGAYVIISSTGSTAPPSLRRRHNAMRRAVEDLDKAGDLDLHFYDRGKIAAWVRCHYALIPWVREKAGRSIQGWHSVAEWFNTADAKESAYILDDQLRVQFGKDKEQLSALGGIEKIRRLLSTLGKSFRLVGLSGVGKTRLIRALFEDGVGAQSLDSSLGLYTDTADDPNPHPVELVQNISDDTILIVDNCSAELHERLTKVSQNGAKKVRILTVEYDIREDQPEGTEVIRLQPASDGLIQELSSRRFPDLSPIDVLTIARFSEGNARIAIALAETVSNDETIAGLDGKDRLWAFGRGLAEGARDPMEIWNLLANCPTQSGTAPASIQLLCGFLQSLYDRDSSVVGEILDDAIVNAKYGQFFPELQIAIPLDDKGIDRLSRWLQKVRMPILPFKALAGGRRADKISGPALKALLLSIAEVPDGLDVAIEILHLRLYSDSAQERAHPPELIEVGRQLLSRISFAEPGSRQYDYDRGEVCKYCLLGDEGASLAALICQRLNVAVSRDLIKASDHDDLVRGLFLSQPLACLNVVLGGSADQIESGIGFIDDVYSHVSNPLDIAPRDALMDWCDQAPVVRFPILSRLIGFAPKPIKDVPLRWTEMALWLLKNSPDPIEILSNYIHRFTRFSGWGAERLSTLQSHVELLDQLGSFTDPAFVSFVAEEKSRLLRVVAEEQERELDRQRHRYQRFE